MRRPLVAVWVAVAILSGFTISCSGSGGSGNTTRPPVPTPTPTPSPTPTVASQYNTMGNITCTAADEAVPGTYVNIETNGTVVGSTYTADASGFNGYQMLEYGPPGATPAPTNPPLAPATPGPSATPGALGIIYYGEYSVPAFTDAGTGTPVDASDGCFQFETTQALGGMVGEARPAPDASQIPSASGYGLGFPAFAAPYPTQTGYVTEPGGNGGGAFPFNTFTITNLTRTTGSGTFTFTINGSSTMVTGTVTITGSTTYPSAPSEDALKLHLRSTRR